MPEQQPTYSQVIKDFITQASLEDEEKQQYLAVIDQLAKGEDPDTQAIENLDLYLNQQVELLEDDALNRDDAADIAHFAELRNARLEFLTTALGIEKNDGPATTPTA